MAWIGAVLGGIGLLNQIQQGNRQNQQANQAMSMQQQGLDLQRQLSAPQIAALNSLLGIANNYNPASDAQAGIARASEIFKSALGQGLGNVASQFAGANSGSGLNTEFNVRSQDVANRVSDPFRAYLADALGNPAQKRAEMFRTVLGAAPSGNLADNYFKAAGQSMNFAGMFQPNYGPSLSMLGGSLNKMLPTNYNQQLGILPPDSSNPFYRGDPAYSLW